MNDRAQMLKIINSAICTKALSRWSTMACNIALDAVRTVELEEHGRKEINIKLYAKVEKVSFNVCVKCLAVTRLTSVTEVWSLGK